MGCINEPNEWDGQAVDKSAEGKNCNPDPQISEEWENNQTLEAREELSKEIDKISEETRQSGEKLAIPPENLKDWAEYLDIVSRNLERVARELPIRFELLPEIRGFEKSGVIDNKDVSYYLLELSMNALKTDRSAFFYKHELKINPEGKIIRGETPLFEPEKPTVIYKQPPVESLKGTPPEIREKNTEEAIVHAIYHEHFHNIMVRLPQDMIEKWNKLHEDTSKRDAQFVTLSASRDYLEDFSECLWVYKEHPYYLFKMDIQKFRFFNELTKKNYI